MVDDRKIELFETRSIPNAVMTLAIPTVLSSLVMVIYNLSDTFFVGMLNEPIQNAAVTLAAPLLLAFNAVNNLFGVGASSMMSRAMGRKDYDTVSRSSAFGFYCAILSGLFFSLAYTLLRVPALKILGADPQTAQATGEYLLWTVSWGAVPAILNVVMAYLLRAEGSTVHASIGTMSGCLLNIILDPIFILPWGLDMGASGAGLATCISNVFACGYFFVLLFVRRKRTAVCIRPKMFGFRRSIVTGVCAVGIPAAIQNLLNVTGMTILNNFAAVGGADAVAAVGIAQKINMVPLNMAMGFSQGVMPLVSYNYSSGNGKRLRETITYSLKVSLIFVVAAAVICFFGAEILVAMFMKNETIIGYGAAFLKGFSLALPFLALDFLAVGVFQACGMGKRSLIFALLRKIVLEIPALYILNLIFPLYGLAYAQFVAEVILATVAMVMLQRIFKSVEAGQTLRK